MGKREDILNKIDNLALMISNKYEDIHIYNGKDVRIILEDILLEGSTAEEINDLIECNQITYKDGELIIDIKDTDILLELQGKKYINLVTEHVYFVKLMNTLKANNIGICSKSYCELSEQLEEIKVLAARLVKIDSQFEK